MLEAVLSKISKSDKSRSSSREWHWGPWMPLCVIHREKPPQEVQMLIGHLSHLETSVNSKQGNNTSGELPSNCCAIVSAVVYQGPFDSTKQ